MQHTGTLPIRTRRLQLRRFMPGDAGNIFKWSGSAKNSRYVMERPHQTLEQAEQLLDEFLLQYQNDDFYLWAIAFQGEVIGYITGNEISEETKSVSLGYCIREKYWGRGLVTEAAAAVVDYLFSVGFDQIRASHHPDNPASGRVMQKIGMTFEGRIHNGSMLAGKVCDCMQYALTRSDWEKRAETECSFDYHT